MLTFTKGVHAPCKCPSWSSIPSSFQSTNLTVYMLLDYVTACVPCMVYTMDVKSIQTSPCNSLVCSFRRRKKNLVHTVHNVPSSLGNLHTTPLHLNLLRATVQSYTLCETSLCGFEVRNNITLSVNAATFS